MTTDDAFWQRGYPTEPPTSPPPPPPISPTQTSVVDLQPVAPPPIGQGGSWTGDADPEGMGGWLAHFAIFAVTYMVVVFSMYLFGLGLLLAARIFRSTGFRARDLLFLMVPVANAYFVWRALWRFTARTRYWTDRTDLTPGLFGPGNTLRGV